MNALKYLVPTSTSLNHCFQTIFQLVLRNYSYHEEIMERLFPFASFNERGKKEKTIKILNNMLLLHKLCMSIISRL